VAWRAKFVRSVEAKRKAARKWSNWEHPAPSSVRAFAPDNEYYEAMPEMPADFYNKFAWKEEEERRRALLAGEGISRGGGARCNLFFTGEGRSGGGGGARRDLVFTRNNEEEAAALAQAVAESEAKLTAMAKAEREEQERAIAEVQAFIAREVEQANAMTNWVILGLVLRATAVVAAAGSGELATAVNLGNPRLV
jgi:hypothetical protein